MNIYKLISTCAAGGIIVAGCVYLFAGAATLPFVLVAFCLMLVVMGTSGALEQRKAKSNTLGPYIPSICFFVLGLAVCAAAIYKFLN